jgi:hypothetical protein
VLSVQCSVFSCSVLSVSVFSFKSASSSCRSYTVGARRGLSSPYYTHFRPQTLFHRMMSRPQTQRWTVKRDRSKTLRYSGERDLLADKADSDSTSILFSETSENPESNLSSRGDVSSCFSLDNGYEQSSIPSENMSRLARKHVNKKSNPKLEREFLTINKLNTAKLELVGRDDQKQILRNAFDRAREGNASIVTIMGE